MLQEQLLFQLLSGVSGLQGKRQPVNREPLAPSSGQCAANHWHCMLLSGLGLECSKGVGGVSAANFTFLGIGQRALNLPYSKKNLQAVS